MKFWVDYLLLTQWNMNYPELWGWDFQDPPGATKRAPGEFQVFQADTKGLNFPLSCCFVVFFLHLLHLWQHLVIKAAGKDWGAPARAVNQEFWLLSGLIPSAFVPLQEPPFHEGGGPGRAHRRGPEKEICPEGWRPGPEGEVMLLALSSVSKSVYAPKISSTVAAFS